MIWPYSTNQDKRMQPSHFVHNGKKMICFAPPVTRDRGDTHNIHQQQIHGRILTMGGPGPVGFWGVI